MQLGPWEWWALETGRFRLDGGAMFGNVPKVLWERNHPADEANRIDLALRCLLLKGHDRLVLIDTGMGHKWSDKELSMYHLDYSQFTLETSLNELGFGFKDITDVILTHLHFDHAGGATYFDGDTLKPRFPYATYYIQKANLETAQTPNVRERASYLSQNFEPLIQNGKLKVIEGDGEIIPGIHARLSHGHTQGMQVVKVYGEESGPTLNYCADLIPTRSHVSPAFTMGYDVQPVLVIEEKMQFLDEIEREQGYLFYEHDAHVAASRLGKDKKGRHAAGDVVLKAP